MKTYDLIALLKAPPGGVSTEGLDIVSHAGFSAVLCPMSSGPFWKLGRKRLLDGSVRRQQIIENLMQYGPVVPVLPGTKITLRDVPGMIASNLALLDRLHGDLDGCVQFQVTVEWNEDGAAERFGFDTFEARRETARDLSTQCADLLDRVALERLEMPIAGAAISNNAVLIEAARESDLDTAVEAIDSIWSEGLRIRQVGPSPAVSFASVGLRRADRADIDAALKNFGLSQVPDPERLRPLRREALRNAAEAERARIKRNAEILVAAYDSGSAKGPLHLAFVWREGRSNATDISLKEVA